MKGGRKMGTATNRALPLARSITLAQIEAAIAYWRQQGRRHYDPGPAPGEQQATVLEQLYARILMTRQGAVWAAQLTVYEYDALLGGLPARPSR
ncbi:hypothetical protein BZM27_50175 [Paraburkholderia steynii]|uniref:DUF3717 domain-containing protein n=1 Tax=Paraburkholderia steynii TaxID=1245441 RepID=A0A4R0X961_9BURK|nr:hypothetical protein BZM27_50175 [Paraburkholderia steynii]